jgi:putative copper resistance protein D
VSGFVDVILRGLALGAQAIAIGGVAFVLFVLMPAAGDAETAALRRRALAITALAATALAAIQLLLIALLLGVLGGGDGWPLAAVAQTSYFWAGAVRIVACAVVMAFAGRAARGAAGAATAPVLVALALVLALSAAWLSHAAARLGGRALLLAIDSVHQLAAGVWIGGLVHLVAAAVGGRARQWWAAALPRFSTMALVAAAVVVAGGLALTRVYVDGPRAFVGTSYGVMVLTKVVLLGGLLVLGGLNFLAVRRARGADGGARLHRFVEVEVGLGMTALFVAASLTSLPVAADVQAARATPAEVLTRFTPRMPALSSPPIEALPVDDRAAPRTDADRAWSEYNHHMSGIFVLVAGVLAVLHASGRAAWARHWPLTFLGLAAFMLVRNDPGSWPLGPAGFWESMAYPEVLQHRIFVLLVVIFGTFEWMVRAGRLRSPRCALLFPVLCAIGGALLLTHSHANLNLKDEFLTEVTHAPLGLLGIVVGWGRWLELRLPPAAGRWPGRLSAWAFALVGALLLIYRES